jgi:hypothetical protein
MLECTPTIGALTHPALTPRGTASAMLPNTLYDPESWPVQIS